MASDTMASGIDLEQLHVRTCTLSLALQGLMVELDALRPGSVGKIRRLVMHLASDLKAHPGAEPLAGDERLESDVRSFFEAIER